MKVPSRITEKNLVLIELNEVNLELAKNYVDKLGLKTFSQILVIGCEWWNKDAVPIW